MKSTKSRQNQHSRTRSDHATELAEDYVEAIAEIIADQGTCRAVDLVKQFQVTHVTVNRTVGRLQRDGFVQTDPYGPLELTEAGRRLAKACHERHQIVYDFLKALGLSDAIAATDSEGIEHHVSPATLKAMQKFVEKNVAGS